MNRGTVEPPVNIEVASWVHNRRIRLVAAGKGADPKNKRLRKTARMRTVSDIVSPNMAPWRDPPELLFGLPFEADGRQFPTGCLFIDGEPLRDSNWSYCQHRRLIGSSYCQNHHGRCRRTEIEKVY